MKFMRNWIIIPSSNTKENETKKEQKKQVNKGFMLLANLDLYTFLSLLYNHFSFLRRKCFFLSKSLCSNVYLYFLLSWYFFCNNILGI